MRKWWLAAVTLALATPSWGAEGSWTNKVSVGRQMGGMKLTAAVVACDDMAATPGGDCVIDFGAAGSPGQGDLILFYAPEEGSTFVCTGAAPNTTCTQQASAGDCGNQTSFALTTGPSRTTGSGTPPTGSNRNVATVSSLDTVGTDNNWLVLNTRYVPLNRYLFVAATLGATCTTNDLLMFIYEDQETP